MSGFVELQEGFSVRPEEIVVVKQSELELDRCTVFLKGQSALDGFVIDRDREEVLEILEAAAAKTSALD